MEFGLQLEDEKTPVYPDVSVFGYRVVYCRYGTARQLFFAAWCIGGNGVLGAIVEPGTQQIR